MDFRDVIKMGLEEYMQDLKKALDGLAAEERRFQPGPDSHHIDYAVWHIARVEDGWMNRGIRRGPQVWERDGWAEKLGLPERDNGFGYTSEQLANFPAYDPGLLMEYYDAVRVDTLLLIDSLTDTDLERPPNPERDAQNTIAKILAHVLIEEAQHVGQIAYLRGLQRGLDK
tara:strand:+ start:147 stop:659 length:513 start_codon:yes stop_codon:yes gene_type:complete